MHLNSIGVKMINRMKMKNEEENQNVPVSSSPLVLCLSRFFQITDARSCQQYNTIPCFLDN